MKIFLLALSISIASVLCAAEVRCEKTYVKGSQIRLFEACFFVQVDNLFIQPTSLYTDAAGFYFDTVYVDERCPGPWQCRKNGCNTWNDEWRDICKQCGKSRT